MELMFRNDCPEAGVDEKKLLARCRRVLEILDLNDAELSVLLCNDDEMRKLHRDFLGEDSPTNVMSFSQREGEFGDLEPEMLGDIAISVDTAGRDASEAGKNLDDEVFFLLIHGILHLVGYDHEGDNSHMAQEMEQKEEELFRMAVHEA